MYCDRKPPSYQDAQRYRVNRPAFQLGELGAAFLSKKSDQPKRGMFGVGRSGPGPTETANRYEGSSCPPGQSVVRRETEQHAAKFAGGPTRTDYVYCRPSVGAGPGPAPAAARQEVSPTITVSPTFQQQFTPQISPVFQQTQDSPGAQQAATPVQSAPGGQEATGGGSGGSQSELLEFMRQQEQRRAAEEEARRRREDARRAEQAAQQRAEREREQEARARAEAEQRRRQAELEQQRQAELEEMRAAQEAQQAQPQAPRVVYSAGAPPRSQPQAPTGAPQPTAEPEPGGIPPWAIIAGGAAIALLALAGGNRKPSRAK